MSSSDPSFAAELFFVGVVALADDVSTAEMARLRQRQVELMSRLDGEPGVRAVTCGAEVDPAAGAAADAAKRCGC